MRKLAAISLICLLSFNWFGFRIVEDILSGKADQQLEAQLDNNQYDESQLIEVRVSLNVPYQTSQSEFERHYGEIEANGVIYTYVKSRIDNGELVLKCIPNETKKEIRTAGNNYYKLTNGLDQDQPAKKSNTQVAKQFAGDFDDQLETFMVKAPVRSSAPRYARYSSMLSSTDALVGVQPPDTLA